MTAVDQTLESRYKRYVQDKMPSARMRTYAPQSRILYYILSDGARLSGLHEYSEDAWRDAAIRMGVLS